MKSLIKKSVFFSFLGMFLISCEKDDNLEIINPNYENSPKKMYRLSNQDIFDVFDNVYSNYDIAIFCQCDCNAFSIAQNEVKNHLETFPDYQDYNFRILNCSDYATNSSCGKPLNSSLMMIDEKIQEIVNLNFIDNNEKDFLIDFINDVVQNPTSINFQSYRDDYNNFAPNDLPLSSEVIDVTIHYVENAVNYFDDFTPRPGDIEPNPFIVNKVVGGIIGGFTSCIIEAAFSGGDMDGGDYGSTFGKGFLGGAITSI